MPKSENKTKIRCSLCKRKFTSVEKLRRHENLSEMHKENLAKAAAAEKETEAAVARSLTTCTVISKPDAVVPTKASRSSVPDPASVSRDDKKNSAVEIQPIEGLGEEDIEDSKPKAKAKPTPKRKKTADWENKKVDENCSISSTGRLTRSTRARKGTNSTPVEKTQALDDASASTTRRVTRRMGNAIEETKPATEESKLNTSEVGRKRRGGNAIEEKKPATEEGKLDTSEVTSEVRRRRRRKKADEDDVDSVEEEKLKPRPKKRLRVSKKTSQKKTKARSDAATKKLLRKRLSEARKAKSLEKTPLKVEDGLNISFPEDKYFLTPVMCLLRDKCVEMFAATQDDVDARDVMGRPILLGQVGVRCIFCRTLPYEQRATRSVSFPSVLSRLYNVLLKLQGSHVAACPLVPSDILTEFNALKSANVNRCKSSSKYVVKAAIKAGIDNCVGGLGICFSDSKAKPDVDTDSSLVGDVTKTNENSAFEEEVSSQYNEIYCKDDKHLVTDYLRLIMLQYKICSYDDSYYLYRKDKYIREGYPGLTCKFCVGTPEECRLFWPTSCRMSENFEIGYDHLMKCKLCPEEIKNQLLSAKTSHAAQMMEKEHWFLKAYCSRVWEKMFRTVAEERLDFTVIDKIGTRGNAAASADKILACDNDEDYLPPLDCFIRRNVQLFRASPNNTLMQPMEHSCININTVMLPGQVGMRCIHCAKKGTTEKNYWPESVEGVVQVARLMYIEHLNTCPNLTPEDKAKRELMSSEKFDRNAEVLDYYFTSASVHTGLVDSMIMGVRYIGDKGALPPPVIECEDDEYGLAQDKASYARIKKVEPEINAQKEEQVYTEEDIDDSDRAIVATARKEARTPHPDAIINEDDFQYMSNFKLLLMHQLTSCQFSAEDRTSSSRFKIRPGFQGISCKHCDSGKAFPRNVKALGKNAIPTLYQHIRTECEKCPSEIKHALAVFRTTHSAEVEELEYNSQTLLAKNMYQKMVNDAKRASKANKT